MKSNNLLILILLIFLGLFLTEIPALADMGGIVYFVIPAFVLFTWPIVSFVEGLALRYIYKSKIVAAVILTTLLVNLVSLVVGIIIFFSSELINTLIETAPAYQQLPIYYVLTVLIELPFYHLFLLKISWLDSLKKVAIINLLSYIVLSIPFLFFGIMNSIGFIMSLGHH